MKITEILRAQGPAQGIYLLLKLPLGHFSFHWAKAGQKESMVRVLKLPRHWVQGQAQGVYLLPVLKLLLAVGHFSFHWAEGRAQGAYLPICYGS